MGGDKRVYPQVGLCFILQDLRFALEKKYVLCESYYI